jgi:hypothetical protein
MRSRGRIRFWGGADAVFVAGTRWPWKCSNKFLEILLNLAFSRFLNDITPDKGYPPAYLVLKAAKFVRATVIELPVDDKVYPPGTYF